MLDVIRQYKFPYKVYNFFHRNKLKYLIPLYQKYGIKKAYYSAISSEDFKDLKSPKNTFDAENSRELMPTNENFKQLPEHIQTSILNWSEKGYAIIDKFYSDDEVEAINSEIESLLKSGTVKFKYGNKIMFAMNKSSKIKDAGTHPLLLKTLECIMDKKVTLFQSINFKTGSEQRTHSDSIHMTTFPYGNLIAVWVALEDISLESGPLVYYPGSHKLPYVLNREFGNIGSSLKIGTKTYVDYEDHIEQLIQEKGLQSETFLAKKGDILIWHANLLHGGMPMLNNKLSRKSMVFHYYAKDVICFHEITQRPALIPS